MQHIVAWTVAAIVVGLLFVAISMGGLAYVIAFYPPIPERDCAEFVRDVTIPDEAVLAAGSTHQKIWLVRNCGTTTWRGYKAVKTYGAKGFGEPVGATVPETRPNQEVEVHMTLRVPTQQGTYLAVYEIAREDGLRFGEVFWVVIRVQ